MTLPPSIEGLWPLVARDDVLARARAALARPGCAIVVLSGESGVGKTRVATELAAEAAEAGRAVVRIAANALLTDVPLGAVAGLGDVDAPTLAAIAHDPAALFAAARAAAAGVPGTHPALIVVDDLPALDAVSTTLVARLVASGDAALLATQRDGDPLPDAVVALWSPDRCERLELGALGVDEVEALLARVLGAPVAHHAAVELHAAAEGNPLHLRELVLGAHAAGRLAESAGVWQLVGAPVATPALRELVLARVRRLDDAARDVVERLAACSPLPVAQLPGTDALATVARLEAEGWVEVEQTTTLVARLAHPQYAAAVREGLPVLRRAQIAGEQAAALEADPTGPTDALRIARWRIAAGQRPDPDALATAAALARQIGDHRTVDELARAALAAGGPRPDLLLLRGDAVHRLGRVREGIALLEDALALDVAHPSAPELTMGITATLAFAYGSVPAGMEQGIATLDRLRGTTPVVELMRSMLEMYRLRPRTALALVDAVAPQFGDSPVERTILDHARAQPLGGVGRSTEAVEAARAALAVAQTLADQPSTPLPVALAAQTLAVTLLDAGRLGEAHDAATLALRAAVATDDEFLTRTAEFRLGLMALEQGRTERAVRWFRESRSGALSLGPESLIVPSTAQLAIALFTQGEATQADALLAEIPSGTAVEPTQLVAFALSDAMRGALDAARERLVAGAHEMLEEDYAVLAGQYLFWLARFGDPATAARELERVPQDGIVTLQTAHARAEADGDRGALEAAAAAWERAGGILYAAEAFASAARAARSAGDARGATSLQGRADALAAQTQGAATPLLAFRAELSPLTRREREIATLAARGRSSKEIAEELFLSARTVDNHLQSIYGKLGVRGRRELTDALH